MSAQRTKAEKHTTGPWHIDDQEAVNAITIWSGFGSRIGGRVGTEVASLINNGSVYGTGITPSMRANARLIAAAPDLLDALRDAYALSVAWAASYQHDYELKEQHPTHAAIVAKSRDAILKAGGEL